jgi:PKD repeat protein
MSATTGPLHRRRPRREARARTRTAIVTVLGLVLGLAWVGAAVAEQATAAPAVQYGGATSATQTKPTRSVTLRKPAGTAVGDVLVASFTASGAARVSTPPKGWTSLLPQRLGAGRSASVFAYLRVVTAADLRTRDWTWTLAGRRAWRGGVARYEGVDRVRPVDTSVSVASSRSPRSRLAVPGVRTTMSGTMLIGGVGAAAARSTVTPPPGWTKAWKSARGLTAVQAHRPLEAAGDTGRRVWKVTAARPLAGWMTALRPAGGSLLAPAPTSSPVGLPSASFTASPTQGAAPLEVDFTDTSRGAPTSWAWDFGDGATGTTQHPSHTYTSAGTYTVTLRATNAAGSDTAAVAVVVEPTGPGPVPPPTASFTVSPRRGIVPLTTTFTDTSTGSPTSWAWDFGDGTTATTQNPSHTYASVGTYTVTLRATNASGAGTTTKVGAVLVEPVGANVLVGAGDIADCTVTEDSATAALVADTPGTVFTLGDNAYLHGTAAEFAACYEPTWGAVKARTKPVAGNHEYDTTNAAPYYAYFGASAGDPAKGWYSYDIGTDWHVVVLNSNCAFVGGCAAGSPQHQWLRADLAASTRPCTVAMWHHPRYSSGTYGQDDITTAFWQTLYEHGAELVLNGHEHDYERFAPQDPKGNLDPAYGMRQIVVGTGGASLRTLGSVAPHSEVRNVTVHGVLKLTLEDGSYDWRFLPIPGATMDEAGTGSCHGAPPTTGPPTASFVASATGGTAPLPVSFTDTSTGGPTSWLWDFGDGTTSTQQSPSHTYATPGSYTVSLRATNALGSTTSTAADPIDVTPEPPPPPAGSDYRDTVLWDGAVGYWRLGETSGTSAADETGAAPGVITGGVTQGVSGVADDGDAAVRLDGSTGYVRIADRAALNYTAHNFSVEAWARPTAIGTAGGAVLQKSSTSGYAGYQYRLSLTSAGRWRATVFVGTSDITVTDTGTSPSTTRWSHLVLVRSGSQLTLYVNGAAAATTTFSGSVNTSTGILAIGRSGASSDGYFNGAVDEVAVYPSALTPRQVLRHYDAATSR